MKGLSIYVAVMWVAYIAAITYLVNNWSAQNHAVVVVSLTAATAGIIAITEYLRVMYHNPVSGEQPTEPRVGA